MTQQDYPHYLPFFLTDTLFYLPDEEVIAEAETLNAPAKEGGNDQVQQAPAGKQDAALPEIQVVGKNQKGIAIFVHDAAHPVMSRQDGIFLKNVLQALQLSFDDVLLINTNQCSTPEHWKAVATHPFRFAIAFDLPELPTFAPVLNKAYQPVSANNSVWLKADSLQTIAADVSRKKLLWNALKQLFVGL